MSDTSMFSGSVFESSDAIEALKQLEVSSRSAVMQKRGKSRLTIEINVTIQRGDSSRRSEFTISGSSSDISTNGCKLLAPTPVLPGDVYWLQFAKNEAGIGNVMARCVRCHMIREDAFEIGMTFFNEIDLSSFVD
ncbi:MAG: PilZ domain-containing protein [Planctomycetaceae bacterium]